MKKFALLLTVASFAISCNENKVEETATAVLDAAAAEATAVVDSASTAVTAVADSAATTAVDAAHTAVDAVKK